MTRRMVVPGDELTLRLPPTAVDRTPVVRTLTWRRVAKATDRCIPVGAGSVPRPRGDVRVAGLTKEVP